MGMVNNFRDFIPSLSSYLQLLTELTKKQNFGENGFEITENALSHFRVVKDKVVMHTSKVLMNPSDPLILYTNASTWEIGGFQM